MREEGRDRHGHPQGGAAMVTTRVRMGITQGPRPGGRATRRRDEKGGAQKATPQNQNHAFDAMGVAPPGPGPPRLPGKKVS